MITKPMLASSVEDIYSLKYPIYISPKLDGIRCLKVNGEIVSRKLKPIPNNHIRELLNKVLPEGADGEIISGSNFQETSSAVMTIEGTPEFRFYWFDWVRNNPKEDFLIRQLDFIFECKKISTSSLIVPLKSDVCRSPEELLVKEEEYLKAGYEGVMIRSGSGKYKFGRSTVKEGYLLKLKRFLDSEAIIKGFQEKMINNNEAEIDALGHTERSSKKEGLIPANSLGSLIVQDCKSGLEFSIGSGFTSEQRKEIWENRKEWMGRIVKYKYQSTGIKEAPRFPIWLGVRHPEDM